MHFLGWAEKTPAFHDCEAVPARAGLGERIQRPAARDWDLGCDAAEFRRRPSAWCTGTGGRFYLWIACEAKSTRALTAFARKELAIPKDRMHAMAYRRA